MRKLYQLVRVFALYFVYTFSMQLFLFLLSFPIILGWGLPVSLLTLFATPIFAPFLTLVLFIATMIFLFFLLHISYVWLLIPLNWSVLVWNYFLSFGTNAWLFYFPIPHQFIIIIFACINCMLLLYVLKYPLFRRLELLSCYTIIVFFILFVYKAIPRTTHRVLYDKRSTSLKIISKNSGHILLDRGFMQGIASPASWVQYTLYPMLISQSGSLDIELLVLKKLTKRTEAILLELLKCSCIKHIILPDMCFFSEIQNSDFSFLVDKLREHCVIITYIKERHNLFCLQELKIRITYDKGKKSIEV